MHPSDVCNFTNICLDTSSSIFKLMTDTYFHYYYGIFCILELLKIMSNFSILVKEMHAMTFNLAVKSKEKGPFEKLTAL